MAAVALPERWIPDVINCGQHFGAPPAALQNDRVDKILQVFTQLYRFQTA